MQNYVASLLPHRKKALSRGLYYIERMQFVASANNCVLFKVFMCIAINKINDACRGIVCGMLDLHIK